MNKQQQYNHIRQVLTEAFPELLELKLGCEVMIPGHDGVQTVLQAHDHACSWVVIYYLEEKDCLNGGHIGKGEENLKKCILGRPPLITDVLRWLILNGFPFKQIGSYANEHLANGGIKYGDCIVYNPNDLQEPPKSIIFDLSQPELINQSEETLQALSELMDK